MKEKTSLERNCRLMPKRLMPHAVLGLILWNCLTTGCTSSTNELYKLPQEPDYTDSRMWYQVPESKDKAADVFYITPTCIWDWVDEQGDTCYYMNTSDMQQRAAVDGSNRLAWALFEKSCRFYSPYYRQISMNSWMQPANEIENRYSIAHQDIIKAFHYYMEHFNGGRPFVLAGHSQGAKAVIELLKHTLTDAQRQQMVAAYAFGFSITGQELTEYRTIQPARDSLDLGVLICYNSVSHPDAVSPLFANNQACINPLNWRTDDRNAPASENLGSVFFNAEGKADTLRHTVGACLDSRIHTLIINGLNDDDYYIPPIGSLFPKGNFHVQEINLYFLNIQHNLQQRINKFVEKGTFNHNE